MILANDGDGNSAAAMLNYPGNDGGPAAGGNGSPLSAPPVISGNYRMSDQEVRRSNRPSANRRRTLERYDYRRGKRRQHRSVHDAGDRPRLRRRLSGDQDHDALPRRRRTRKTWTPAPMWKRTAKPMAARSIRWRRGTMKQGILPAPTRPRSARRSTTTTRKAAMERSTRARRKAARRSCRRTAITSAASM